ncbi:MAG: class I SAM-dependent methyltransferase [Lautropia sp.]|nr:class I SAM-dependent methyltransferase [Lautropia sp.]
MSYQKHAAYNLFYRPGAEAFGYSEGAEAEQRLLDIVESVSDRSTFSPEWLERIVDWSTRYHFTRARHCLVRPLDIQPGERVLELGCGAGAITRYLGETGAEVTAVEGSQARAKVAAARCADLPNVTVIADDLQAVDVQGQYDWVTLIGVLEYAAAYSTEEKPYQAYLASAIRHLKPGGKVVIAIENQLGLKYFNGCGEDHLGQVFVGLQDLYPARGARTFGRQALAAVLSRAGLTRQQWLYPYPDYKVPSVVLTDAALQHEGFNAADLLLRNHSEDYTADRPRLFDEALVNRVLGENGLLGDFSPSFLVVAQLAGAENQKIVSAGWQPGALAWSFAAVHRQVCFSTETRFQALSDGNIRVAKQRIRPDLVAQKPLFGEHRISLSVETSDYFQGWQQAWSALHAHAAHGTIDAMVDALLPWAENLLASAQVGQSPLVATSLLSAEGTSSGDTPAVPEAAGSGTSATAPGKPLRLLVLPGQALDWVPFNVLVNGQGLQQVIDQEWQVSCPIPAGWVLTRGILHALHVGQVPKDKLGSIRRVILALADVCGYYVTHEDIEQWLSLEEGFLRSVSAREVLDGLYTGTQRPGRLMSDVLQSLHGEVHQAQQRLEQISAQVAVLEQHRQSHAKEAAEHLARIDQYQQQIRALEHQVQALLTSRSWRWSGWLRSMRRRIRI